MASWWTHVLITFHQMKRLQQKMSKVYLRQQAKGGIIDLEEEGRRMLVVTRGEQEENSSGTEFTELSPTDYQLGRQHFPIPPWKPNSLKDCVGIPCPPGPASQPTSPKKQQEEGQWKGGWQGHAGKAIAAKIFVFLKYVWIEDTEIGDGTPCFLSCIHKSRISGQGHFWAHFSQPANHRSRRRQQQKRGKSRREKQRGVQ